MNWLMEHMDDPDIDKDEPVAKPTAAAVKAAPTNEMIEPLTAMGFTRPQAIKALNSTVCCSRNLRSHYAGWSYCVVGSLVS